MWVVVVTAAVGAALGTAVAFVWRFGAGPDNCIIEAGGITPACEASGPAASAVIWCAVLGALLAGVLAVWLVHASRHDES